MNETRDRQLRELASRLIFVVDSVSLRGSGQARFLYVVGKERSAEVSLDGDRLWAEFWDSLDPEAEAVSEDTYLTTEEAVDALTKRLT